MTKQIISQEKRSQTKRPVFPAFPRFKEEIAMKFVCQKDLLVEAVSNVSRAVCAKSPIPALEGILLKAQEGQLQLTGYDLELGIVTTIEAKTEQQGELVLSAKLLLDIIRRIPGETVSIVSDEKIWQPSGAELRSLPFQAF